MSMAIWSGQRIRRSVRLAEPDLEPFGRQDLPRAVIAGGQAIGQTDRLAGQIIERPVHFGEVLATLYRQLGVDPNKTTVRDLAGRPQYLVDGHQPMAELL